MKKMTYAEAGVDIEKGDRFAAFVAGLRSPAVSPSIGGFSGGIPFNPADYREPMLFSTTDGVGTKLLVAQALNRFDTLGIDLVAMNVNDLAVCNVQPLTFLDYIACSSVASAPLEDLIAGMVRGCEIAGCTLVGGETAEMPDLYDEDDFDLAGFCCGIAERSDIRPRLADMQPGDPLYAFASSGVHSNGLSLARKVVSPEDPAWVDLLTPTRIYVKDCMALFGCPGTLAAAHITGGGLEGNLQRVLKKGLVPRFSWDWPRPSVFEAIARGVEEAEMRRVFNLGVGIAFVVSAREVSAFERSAAERGLEYFPIGELVHG
ncbi:MAG: phosphoribosylformylglycinamidine cyclo-ligase [Candidatus Competibacteraceae bacterium]|nr:phosphoribosylformylglycinamidine cyclo-ligase [Candidatus Competibacteraceae bacterium]